MIIYNAAIVTGSKFECFLYESILPSSTPSRLLSYVAVNIKSVFEFWLNPNLKRKRLFLDSGAYSAFTRNVTINLPAYCDFIQKHSNEISTYACLDVIGDFNASAINQTFMEAQGLHPLPAFHLSSPLKELERICERYDYFALGGIAGKWISSEQKIKFLDQCFQIVQLYWPKKIHVFGVTAQPILERYPFYSCDSTAAILGGGMGRVLWFKQGKLSHGDWQEELRNYRPATADKDGRSGHHSRRIHNVKQMVLFEEYLTELWRKRGIIWQD